MYNYQVEKVKDYLLELRIVHWVKNLLVFFPLVFSNNLSNINLFLTTVMAFASFSFAASAVYVFNDIFDVNFDKNHNKKSQRPMALGKISKDEGFLLIFVMVSLSLVTAFITNSLLLLIIFLYLLLNFFYTKFVKHFIVLDIVFLATFYLLRIFAGGVVIDINISAWMIASTLFLALTLIIGKRRSEFMNTESSRRTRKNITEYSIEFLNFSLILSLIFFFLTYLFYSIYNHNKEFMFSSLLIFLGILRYGFLVFKKNIGEEPEKIIFHDFQMLLLLMIWISTIVITLY